MTDIVERLRQWAGFGYGVEASAAMREAADEIIRLRAALETLCAKAYSDFDGGRKLRRGDVDKARAALQQEPQP